MEGSPISDNITSNIHGDWSESDFALEPLSASTEKSAFYSDIDALVSNITNITGLDSQNLDANYITITSLYSADKLLAADDGNIYYGKPGNGTYFATVEGFVEGDGGRYFHFYPDTMEKYNVSRLRLSDESAINVTADLVTLAPVNYNNNNATSDVYLASDTEKHMFFPVTCDIQGQLSEAFLVADLTTGLQKLLDPEQRYTVTGGVVQKCYYLPWAAPAGLQNAFKPT